MKPALDRIADALEQLVAIEREREGRLAGRRRRRAGEPAPLPELPVVDEVTQRRAKALIAEAGYGKKGPATRGRGRR